jgi:secreted protein with Ig-like and vWFA domain
VLGWLAGAGSAADAIDADLTVGFLGRMATQTTESVTLQGYTVTRYPARLTLVE